MCACSWVCVCVHVCVLDIPYPCSSQLLKNSEFNSREHSLLKLLSTRLGAVHFPSQLAHKSYAKAPPPHWFFFHVKGLHCHHTGKSAGQWWLALRVHRVLYFAKSKVAEFLCKFKCLLPHASLNFDLHVAPPSCWMRDTQAQKRETIIGVDVVFSFQLVAGTDFHDLPVKCCYDDRGKD